MVHGRLICVPQQPTTPQVRTPKSSTPSAEPTTPTFGAQRDDQSYTQHGAHPLPVLEALSLSGVWNDRDQTSGTQTPRAGSPQTQWINDEEAFEKYTTPRNPGAFPPELISLITQHLYYSILPPPEPFPDPGKCARDSLSTAL